MPSNELVAQLQAVGNLYSHNDRAAGKPGGWAENASQTPAIRDDAVVQGELRFLVDLDRFVADVGDKVTQERADSYSPSWLVAVCLARINTTVYSVNSCPETQEVTLAARLQERGKWHLN